MRLEWVPGVLCGLCLAGVASCAGGTEGEGEGEPCAALCTDGGFDGGEATDFGAGLVECVCTGDAGALTDEACNAYCTDFDVGPDDALLSQQSIPNDKCVCDGTG